MCGNCKQWVRHIIGKDSTAHERSQKTVQFSVLANKRTVNNTGSGGTLVVSRTLKTI